METTHAIAVLAALAQPSRLAAFRLLVGATPEGMPAGDLARRLGVPQNTMSTQLATLARAGLVQAERRGRLIIYRAELDRIRAIATFLLADCCGGRPEVCAPLIADLSPCCGRGSSALASRRTG